MINEIYENAFLAAAAYAQYDLGISAQKVKDELIDNRGFTEEQYNYLNSTYEVISNGYIDDPVTGFSATIFRNKDINSPDYGKTTLAFRGTNPEQWQDLYQDALLALGQGTENDFQESVLGSFLLDSGILNQDGTENSVFQGLNIVGHSLGGYLSIVAANRLSAITSSVYTYNGAGIAPLDSLFDYLDSNAFLDIEAEKVPEGLFFEQL